MMTIEFESEFEKQVFLEELEYVEDFMVMEQIDKCFQQTIKLDKNKIKNLLKVKKEISEKK